jgi:hypothetical protein
VDVLERMLAERACERLCYDYCRVADEGHHSLLADIFTEDGIFDIPGLRLDGREAIRRFFTEREARKELRTRHVCTNVSVDVRSRTEATGLVYLTLYRRRGPVDWSVPVPTTLPALVGTYHDRYARSGGQWLLRSRVQEAPFVDPDDANPLTVPPL